MKAGTKLIHYKGGKYTTLGVATHSETGGEVVIYRNDKDKKTWVRPIDMFYEEVEINGEWVPRFKIVGQEGEKV